MAATRTHAQLFDSHGFAVMSAAEEFNMSYEDRLVSSLGGVTSGGDSGWILEPHLCPSH